MNNKKIYWKLDYTKSLESLELNQEERTKAVKKEFKVIKKHKFNIVSEDLTKASLILQDSLSPNKTIDDLFTIINLPPYVRLKPEMYLCNKIGEQIDDRII